jgi:hypothetical protein
MGAKPRARYRIVYRRSLSPAERRRTCRPDVARRSAPETPEVERARPSPGGTARRLRPLQVGAGMQGFMLWVPVEKLFQTQIGFDAAAIAVMAAAYAAIVPLARVEDRELRGVACARGPLVLFFHAGRTQGFECDSHHCGPVGL